MSRSILRVRERPHIDPDRGAETIVEVMRDGAKVATIYGSQEGIHITSHLFHSTQPLPLFVDRRLDPRVAVQGWVVPLLDTTGGELCPWCQSTGMDATGKSPCKLCARGREIGKVP